MHFFNVAATESDGMLSTDGLDENQFKACRFEPTRADVYRGVSSHATRPPSGPAECEWRNGSADPTALDAT